MKNLSGFILLSLIAAGSLSPAPAGAAPRYEVVLLPDPILAGNGNHNSHARSFLEAGPLFVAAGDVNGDNLAAPQPVLWFKNGRKWRGQTLSDLGSGGSAARFELTIDGHTLAFGSVRDDSGDDIAAAWVLDRTRKGWSDTLIPLTEPGEGHSEARGFVGGDPDRPIIVGAREGNAPGEHTPGFWILDPIKLTATETPLPVPGGGGGEAIAGTVLPGGNLRIIGCADLPGTEFELAIEWVGNPQQGFVANWLPEPGMGLDEYHVLAADPLLRFAVGARFFPGGAFEPGGWATFPSSVGDFAPLPIPSTETGGAHLFAVSGSGTALGLVDHPLADDIAFITRINVPESDARRLPISNYVEDELQDGDFDDLGERGVVSGSISVGGRRRACLLMPTPVEAPYLADIIEDIPIPSALAVGDLERALVWDDTDIVHILQEAQADWKELLAEIDLSRFDIAGFPDALGRAPAIARRQGPAILVTSRVDGPKAAEVQQNVLLWNFKTSAWNLVHAAKLRGGRFQRLRHPLPANVAPFVSPSGSLRVVVGFTPSNGTGDAFDVEMNSLGLSER